jgi:hypothetical protein
MDKALGNIVANAVATGAGYVAGNAGAFEAGNVDLYYANKSLTYLLPPGHTKSGREVREKLQSVGVYRASGHEHLNGCVVVPVLELETGAVKQMYGRRIVLGDNGMPSHLPRHLYLSMPLGGVWNEAALVASRDVIVCEALIDAMTFWCAGYRNVITAFGVNGLLNFSLSRDANFIATACAMPVGDAAPKIIVIGAANKNPVQHVLITTKKIEILGECLGSVSLHYLFGLTGF